jgi:integrase
MDVEGGPVMSGSIRQRSPGSWEVKLEAGVDPATGRRRTIFRTVRGTKREAQARLVTLLNEAAGGGLVDYSKETVAGFLNRWLRDWAAHHASPKTRSRWGQLIDNQVMPRLGGAQMQKIKPAHLTEFYSVLMREGAVSGKPLAAQTVHHVHRLLHRAFGFAVTWEVIRDNPAAHASPPPVADKEIEIPTESEIVAILEHLAKRNRQMHALAIVALATGARRGELCALIWADFDAKAGALRIARSLETTNEEGLRVKSPKTRNGRRTIDIPLSAVVELQAHWGRQQEERLSLGLGRATPDDLIFAMPDGSPLEPDTLSRNWMNNTLAATGRAINLHSLRHHHASSLVRAGVDILAVSRRLGHAKASITLNVYAHLCPDADDKAALALEAMFKRVRHE